MMASDPPPTHSHTPTHRYDEVLSKLRAASDGIEALDEKEQWMRTELKERLVALRKEGQ